MPAGNKSLDIILNQHYASYKVIFLTDFFSKDFLQELWETIHGCSDDTIILLLSAAECFLHENVLTELNEYYQESETWMTSGVFTDLTRTDRLSLEDSYQILLTQK